MGQRRRRVVAGTAAALAMAAGVVVSAVPAWGAEGSIDYVEPGTDGTFKMVFAVPGGAPVDLDSVSVTVGGEPAAATAELATDAADEVRRTTILAIDTSNSMRGPRLAAAKIAATTFLATVPSDVYVGVVTFAGRVSVAQAPTLDRAAAQRIIDEIVLTDGTSLNDGVITATRVAGAEGARNILVLSDGRDTTRTPLADVNAAIKASKVVVDVVALGQDVADQRPLQEMVTAGNGAVLDSDPAALEATFSQQAAELANQVVVSTSLPEGVTEPEQQVAITLQAGGTSYTDEAFVTVQAGDAGGAPAKPTKITYQRVDPGISIPREAVLGGIVAIGLGLVGLIVVLLNPNLGRRRTTTIEERIAAHGSGRPAGATGLGHASFSAAKAEMEAGSLTGQAKQLAQKALESNAGLEAKIGARLEAAGSQFKPAEWVLMHAGIAIMSATVGFLLSRGNPFVAIFFLFLGAVGPWVWLGLKRRKRLSAFNAGLADTLQLMAGSLQAGLSLAQSIDTVVREGGEPISGEFRRILVESRLGVTLEDALEGVADRMESEDFRWVVMAIRIQREVGGNLAELLLTVAATLREREYLRRHVRALSAEGRLSTYVLGGLPPVFLLYLTLTRPDYVGPMFTEPLGWLMLGGMVLLLSVGIFWMSKVVKVDV